MKLKHKGQEAQTTAGLPTLRDGIDFREDPDVNFYKKRSENCWITREKRPRAIHEIDRLKRRCSREIPNGTLRKSSEIFREYDNDNQDPFFNERLITDAEECLQFAHDLCGRREEEDGSISDLMVEDGLVSPSLFRDHSSCNRPCFVQACPAFFALRDSL